MSYVDASTQRGDLHGPRFTRRPAKLPPVIRSSPGWSGAPATSHTGRAIRTDTRIAERGLRRCAPRQEGKHV